MNIFYKPLNVPTCTVYCDPKSLIINDFKYSPAFCMKKVMKYESCFWSNLYEFRT